MQKGSAEREELGSFLYLYLQRRFGVENMITEWGYNLYDACNRYNHDPQIGLFYGILQKEVSARSWAMGHQKNRYPMGLLAKLGGCW